MRVLFLSRRFFPAISGMSVYAVNLLRELVAANGSGEDELSHLDAESKRIAANRIAFVVRGATRVQHSFRLQGVMLAAKMDLAESECAWRKIVAELLDGSCSL